MLPFSYLMEENWGSLWAGGMFKDPLEFLIGFFAAQFFITRVPEVRKNKIYVGIAAVLSAVLAVITLYVYALAIFIIGAAAFIGIPYWFLRSHDYSGKAIAWFLLRMGAYSMLWWLMMIQMSMALA